MAVKDKLDNEIKNSDKTEICLDINFVKKDINDYDIVRHSYLNYLSMNYKRYGYKTHMKTPRNNWYSISEVNHPTFCVTWKNELNP